MSKYKSKEVNLNKSAEEIFNIISDLNNLKLILPSSVKNFKSTEKKCSFQLEGLPQINLEITEKKPFSKISLKAINSQVPFILDCIIANKSNNCSVYLEINAELNFMMKMMLEQPLNNFLNILSSRMKEI